MFTQIIYFCYFCVIIYVESRNSHLKNARKSLTSHRMTASKYVHKHCIDYVQNKVQSLALLWKVS